MDNSLHDWKDIRDRFRGGGLLVGNGASCAVWTRFGYKSLYQRAKLLRSPCQLTDEQIRIFKGLGTDNFESVLRALWTTRMVVDALERATPDLLSYLEGQYEHIQVALLEAVKDVHVPHEFLQTEWEPLLKIGRALHRYRYVYTTNYDLLVYWAFMADGRTFLDYFWPGGDGQHTFNGMDVRRPSESETALHFLHGALHLIRDYSGRTSKVVAAGQRQNLLSLLDHELPRGATRLFVTEGKWEDKMRAIESSRYLSFAYNRFAAHNTALVVFGHSLNEEYDGHIVEALRRMKRHPVAISVRPQGKRYIEGRVTAYRKQLERDDVDFFNSETHPLGKPDLRVMSDVDE